MQMQRGREENSKVIISSHSIFAKLQLLFFSVIRFPNERKKYSNVEKKNINLLTAPLFLYNS